MRRDDGVSILRTDSRCRSGGSSCRHRRAGIRILLAFAALVSSAVPAASSTRLDLQRVALPLPGAPAKILSPDLDGDGRRDLLVVVAFTEWDRIAIEETSELDGVQGLVEVMTVIPALLDKRELMGFLAQEDGGYRALPALPLELGVLALAEHASRDVRGVAASGESSPPPVIALTDEGIAAVRLTDEETLVLEPLLERRPVLAGAGVFLSELDLLVDLDGDGFEDLLFPDPAGLAIFPGTGTGFAQAPSQILALPGDETVGPGRPQRLYPLPEIRDVDADGRPDLLVQGPRGWNKFSVLRNLGGGRFAAAAAPRGLPHPRGSRLPAPEDLATEPQPMVIYFGDLDGDAQAEYLRQQLVPVDDDAGLRKQMAHAKRPPFRYAIHRSGDGLTMVSEPYDRFSAEGYAVPRSPDDVRLPESIKDLDGDGRLDLVTMTLDFSLFKMLAAVALRRFTLGLDFHVYCQGADGSFREVKSNDLSGKFKVNLNTLKLGHFSQFAGDFDGDGRSDFVQMGRGKTVSIHRGQPGCRYPKRPDLTIKLGDKPAELGLVRVDDFDGDGRDDLALIQPRGKDDGETTTPVSLDLYLSGAKR